MDNIGQQGFKVLKVVDTRVWEEGPDDRWFPIPGSGNAHDCARCGKSHEVHVEVLDRASGTTQVVGTGCAAAVGIFSQKVGRNLANLAKRERELSASLAKRQQTIEAWNAAQDLARALPLPAIEAADASASGSRRWNMGDAQVWDHTADAAAPINDERRGCLVNAWRGNRIFEVTGLHFLPSDCSAAAIEADRKRLERIRAQLRALEG